MSDSPSSLTLAEALRAYIDARDAAMMIARRTLNISETDAKALLFVAGNPGTRPTALRDYLGITGAGVTTLTDRLVNRGVVQREVDADDRRVNRITATIDIAAAPWSELRRFDDDFELAIVDADHLRTDELAELLATITTATVNARV
jgi:DNA-binding MarR family transcriptional regulator